MIKRGIVLFCLCCYLANVAGFSYSLNYCNDKLAGVSFNFVDLFQWCCEDGEEGDCCDSQLIQLEKTDDHTTTIVVSSASLDFALPFSAPFTQFISLGSLALYNNNINLGHLPADVYKQPFYILYSVFRV